MKRILFILLELLVITNGLWAIDNHAKSKQDNNETIIVGDVYDAYTGEALSNVNVYIQGTTIGTMSTQDGLFLLRGQID